MTAPTERTVCQHTGTIARTCLELDAVTRERDQLDAENCALQLRECELEAEGRALRAAIDQIEAGCPHD